MTPYISLIFLLVEDATDDAELIANSERLQQELANLPVKDKPESKKDKWERMEQEQQENYERLCRGDLDALHVSSTPLGNVLALF